MLLQRQYSLWKTVNNLLLFLLALLVVLTIYFKVSASYKDRSINDETNRLTNIQNDITKVKQWELYLSYRIADVIKKKENTVNYAALYKYLNVIKSKLESIMNKSVITKNRFILKINKKAIDISLMIPNFDQLYAWWKIDLFGDLSKMSFIESISVNQYKVKGKFVYFDMRLNTK